MKGGVYRELDCWGNSTEEAWICIKETAEFHGLVTAGDISSGHA